MQAGWRSVSMECGEQCVMITGIAMMPGLCADNWDILDQVYTSLYSVKCKAEVVMHCMVMCTFILSNCSYLENY